MVALVIYALFQMDVMDIQNPKSWLNLDLFLIAMKLQLDNTVGDKVFNILPEGKQSELIGRKADFAIVAWISL